MSLNQFKVVAAADGFAAIGRPVTADWLIPSNFDRATAVMLNCGWPSSIKRLLA